MFDDFYGLKGKPFQLTPDPAFYFESLTHRKALSYLGYGLAQGEGFVVITGEVGAGKSTLVAHLMSTIDPSRLTAALLIVMPFWRSRGSKSVVVSSTVSCSAAAVRASAERILAAGDGSADSHRLRQRAGAANAGALWKKV